MKSDLGQRVTDLVKKSGLAKMIAPEAIEYNKYFDLMDQAWESDNIDLFDQLTEKQDALKEVIANIVRMVSPISLEKRFLNNLVMYSIEEATK